MVEPHVKEADAIDLSRWLRPGGERRGDGTGQRGQQEAAPVHAGDGKADEREGQPAGGASVRGSLTLCQSHGLRQQARQGVQVERFSDDVEGAAGSGLARWGVQFLWCNRRTSWPQE
jgi:hypothetical protein